MTNPFAPAVPAQPAVAPTGNPFASPAPAAPQPFQRLATQSYQQASGQVATPPALDLGRLAAAPEPVIGSTGASLVDMYGRLVLIFPLSLQRVPRLPKYITPEQRARGDVEQDRLTATVVVLDGGQIQWGGTLYGPPEMQKPHTDSAPVPYVRKAMWINQSRLISQLRDALPATPGGAPGMIAGRVAKTGPAQNDPWYLIGATEQEVALVRQYLEAVQAGHVPHPLAQ